MSCDVRCRSHRSWIRWPDHPEHTQCNCFSSIVVAWKTGPPIWLLYIFLGSGLCFSAERPRRLHVFTGLDWPVLNSQVSRQDSLILTLTVPCNLEPALQGIGIDMPVSCCASVLVRPGIPAGLKLNTNISLFHSVSSRQESSQALNNCCSLKFALHCFS